MPGASASTHGPACKWKKHTSVVATGEAVSPAFPARWFYGFLRALPGDRAFLPPSSVRCKASSPTWHLPWRVRTTRLRRPRATSLVSQCGASIASRAQRPWRSRSAPLIERGTGRAC